MIKSERNKQIDRHTKTQRTIASIREVKEKAEKLSEVRV